MLFNSHLFLLFFLPITLISWYVLNHYHAYKTAKAFLTLMSLWFYAYFNYTYLFIILGSIALNYGISFWMSKIKKRKKQLIPLWIGIILNILVFFYYKYFDFFIENVNRIFETDFILKNILLPLGISFFTFQQVSFIMDRYRKEAPHYSLIDYMSFVTFFPQLVAGPIVTHDELIPQFQSNESKQFRIDMFTKGMIKFIVGLGKKVLLADTLGLVVSYGYEKIYYLDTPSALVVAVCASFQIYFDFSGYSDMAVGLGNLFGIELPINFKAPFRAVSIQELWKRWHITLTRFFVTYIYVPLGGSKKGNARTFVNVVIVFALSGLWHGANWTFVVWGILNGLLSAMNQLGYLKPKNRVVGGVTTFAFFSLTLIFFKSDSLTNAFLMLQKIFIPTSTGFLFELAGALEIPELYLITKAGSLYFSSLLPYVLVICLIVLVIISIIVIRCKTTIEMAESEKLSGKFCLFCVGVFIWSFVSLSQVSTFMYFNF